MRVRGLLVVLLVGLFMLGSLSPLPAAMEGFRDHRETQPISYDITTTIKDDGTPVPPTGLDMLSAMPALDGFFIENDGQTSKDVRFHTPEGPLSLRIGLGWMAYQLSEDHGSIEVVNVTFEGSNQVEPIGVDAMAHGTNFIIGRDPSQWRTRVDSYRSVMVQGIWECIDLTIAMQDGGMKYEFDVGPGGRPSDIRMSYTGIVDLNISPETGDLLIGSEHGLITDKAPVSFQWDGEHREHIDSAFSVIDDDTVGFVVGKYDATRDLVIDPGLEFSTYLGGTLREWPSTFGTFAMGDDGSIYCGGSTSSTNLPVSPGAFCATYSGGDGPPPYGDGFVAKLNHNASQLEFLTYFGGTGTDYLSSVRAYENGTTVVTGYTFSDDLPVTQDAYSSSPNSLDAYVLVFDENGSSLRYGSYIGGAGGEWFTGMVIDGQGNLLMTGYSGSTDFPVTDGAFCTTLPGGVREAMIVINFSWTASKVNYATFVGGSGADYGTDIVIDGSGNPVVVGETWSNDFPMTNHSHSDDYGGRSDGIIFKLTRDLSKLLGSSYYGGPNQDILYSVSIAQSGSIWTGGFTGSILLPTSNDGFQPGYGGGLYDGCLARFSHNLSALEYSTFIGGTGPDMISDLILKGDDEVIIAGDFRSPDLPTPRGSMYPDYVLGIQGYILWLDVANNRPINASYVHGSPRAVFMAPDGNTIVLAGGTQSNTLPTTTESYDPTFNGDWDLFVQGITMEVTPFVLPSTPENLTARPMDAYAELSWDEPDVWGNWNKGGYRVYRGLARGEETLFDTIGSRTDYTCYGLTNGQEYFFRVGAFSVVGESPLTPSVNVIPFGLPTEPTFPKATAGCESVLLEWSPPVDDGGVPLLGYGVQRGKSPATLVPIANTANVTLFADTNVTKGERYFYSVMAFHGFATGPYSKVVNAIPYGYPDPPTNLQGTGGDSEVTLAWEPPGNSGGHPIVGYKVMRGRTSTDLAHFADVTIGLSYVDTRVVNGPTYYYTVIAVTDIGASPPSSMVAVRCLGPSDPPMDLVATGGEGSVHLRWGPPIFSGGSEVLGYKVLRGDGEQSAGPLIDVGDVLQYLDLDVENGVTYHYSLMAHTEYGDGLATAVISATPMGRPSMPERLSIDVEADHVVLLWLPPTEDGGSGITGYKIYRGPGEDVMTLLDEVEGDTTIHHDPDIIPGSTYYYSVSAENDRLEGPRTPALDIDVTGPPGSPTGLETIFGDGEVTLTWQAPLSDGGGHITGYSIYMGTSPDTMTLTARVLLNVEHTVTGLKNGNEYFFRLSATNRLGEGPKGVMESAVPLGLPGIPLALSAVQEGGSVNLAWSPPDDDGGTGIVGYVLFRGKDPLTMEPIQVLGDVTGFSDTDLDRRATYYYSIAASNAVGQGGTSPHLEMVVKAAKSEPMDGWSSFLLPFLLMSLVIIGAAAVASTEPGKYRLALIGVPLMSRNSKDEVLNNKNRYAIHGLIIDKPGIHYNAILKEFELTAGVITYHLDVLEKERFIRSVRDGRLKRFYSARAKVPRDQRLTPEEIRESIVEMVKERPDISQMELIEELGIDRDTVGYHLRELVKEVRLESERKGRYVVYRVK